MDLALAQLALIFLPGIIWASIDSRYGSGSKPDQFAYIVRVFVFGVCSHAVLYFLYWATGHDYGYSEIVGSQNIDFVKFSDEIAISMPVSIILAILWLYNIRYRIFMNILHYIGATKRFGSEDVWTFTFNSDQPHVEYIHFRDVKNGFVYAGWVNTWSENESFRELLLRDALIYDSEGNEISSVPHLYISRPKDDIWVEFPYSSAGSDANTP